MMSAEVAKPLATPGRLLDVLLACPAPAPVLSEIGRVSEIADGVAIVTGLAQVVSDEVLQFASGVQGVVLDLEPDRMGVILLGASERISVGESVRRTRRVVSVPVGKALLGRVVDALGRPQDGRGAVQAAAMSAIEAPAPAILERSAVTRPLATGINVVDAAVPVGLGQRQLIIGDRQTGKTSLAVDTILNQCRSDVISIYCAVGQRGDAVARVIGALRSGKVMHKTIAIVAGDEEPPGLAFIAPYAAMAMAEHFSAEGRDVLIVMDDLTHHARAYRELSLLLRRPPGREAYPSDIFYVHARLLERAGQFAPQIGGGSITVLPVVETQAENLSAYIPTNLISITDGQIYLSPRLVHKNQFPAVDLGKSVSRVGGKAQNRAFREVASNLRVTLSQFEELEEFARFGTRLDAATRARLVRGAAVRMAMRQPERHPFAMVQQLTVLLAAMDGLLDGKTGAQAAAMSQRIRSVAEDQLGDIADRIAENDPLSKEDRERMMAVARKAVESEDRDHDTNA